MTFLAQQPKYIKLHSIQFEMRMRLPLQPLNACMLTWLAGCMERCSCIILHSCKNHELLLMSFLCQLIGNPPGSQTNVWSCPFAPFYCCFHCGAAAAAAFLLLNLSLLAVSADFNISSMMSLIASSSCSSGWFFYCSLHSCKNFGPLGRSS